MPTMIEIARHFNPRLSLHSPASRRDSRRDRRFTPDPGGLEARRLLSAEDVTPSAFPTDRLDHPEFLGPEPELTTLPLSMPPMTSSPPSDRGWLESMQVWLEQVENDMTHWIAGSRAPNVPLSSSPPVAAGQGETETLWEYINRVIGEGNDLSPSSGSGF